MSDTGNTVEEDLDQTARIALTVATQLADKFARLREDLARDAHRHSDAEARQLAARFDAERAAARNQLGPVERPEWWDRATIQQIASAHQTAQQWKDHDPAANTAADTISHQVRDRLGIDLDTLVQQARAAEAARASAPVFTDTEYRDGSPYYPSIGKEDALRTIGSADATTRDPRPNQDDRLWDFKRWIGKDADIDRAIAEKFPQLMTEDQLATARASKQERTTATPEYATAAALLDEATNKDARTAADRASDAGRADRLDEPGRGSEIAELELQAREYQALADQGGTTAQKPDELRELAADARAQAQLYRDANLTQTGQLTPGTSESDRAGANDTRSEGELRYDSAERRAAAAADLKAHGISQETIDVRMRADIAQGRPASEAAARTGRVNVPKTGRGRGADRSANRPERSR